MRSWSPYKSLITHEEVLVLAKPLDDVLITLGMYCKLIEASRALARRRVEPAPRCTASTWFSTFYGSNDRSKISRFGLIVLCKIGLSLRDRYAECSHLVRDLRDQSSGSSSTIGLSG